MSEHTVDKDPGLNDLDDSTDTARLAALLWSLDWPGKAEQGQQIWVTLDAELLPKRLYLSKAERLIESGVGFVAQAKNEGVRLAAQLVRDHVLNDTGPRVADFLIERADRAIPPAESEARR